MRFNIQNENNTYKKISIVSKDSLGRIFPYGPGPHNPTLTLNEVDERDVLNVCLAPSSDISCEGASNQLDLSMSGNFPELSITVNDVTRVFADTGSPSDELENGGVGNSRPHIAELIEYMGINYPDISIYLSCGGELSFSNNSYMTSYRIRLACLDEVYFDWVSPDNPTAQLSNDNTVVSFCLAPSEAK